MFNYYDNEIEVLIKLYNDSFESIDFKNKVTLISENKNKVKKINNKRKRNFFSEQYFLKKSYNRYGGYQSQVYYVNELWRNSPREPFFRRFYLSGRKKFAKKQTNKRLRTHNYKYFDRNYSGYRKVFDYWWTVY